MLFKESDNQFERAVERAILNIALAVAKAIKARQHRRWRQAVRRKVAAMLPGWLHGR